MRGPKLALVALCAGIALAACGDDDDGGGTSAADLKQQLLPESQLPVFKAERNFKWDNAVDATFQGLFLPEETPPSEALDAYEEADFAAGAAQSLVVKEGNTFEGPRGFQAVIEFGSDEDASEVLEFVHEQDLKQPCFAVCSVNPSELAVDGIPGAKGAKLVPLKKPPPNAPPPFEAYAVEFTIGPRLYMVNAGGGPGQAKANTVLDAARQLYARNKGSS
jgi:hypothetical protein